MDSVVFAPCVPVDDGFGLLDSTMVPTREALDGAKSFLLIIVKIEVSIECEMELLGRARDWVRESCLLRLYIQREISAIYVLLTWLD